ncbi:MAG: hypothetical protein Q9217_001506 [Psora testacea]
MSTPGIKKIKTYPPPPSAINNHPFPLQDHNDAQLKVLDPTGTRSRLFDRSNPDCPQPGDILLTTFKSGDPFAGVCLSIRRRGIDTAVLLRNKLLMTGVEMWVKIYSPNVRGIEVVKRAEKRARRARLYYMRKPKHDRGSVESEVEQYLKRRRLIRSGALGVGDPKTSAKRPESARVGVSARCPSRMPSPINPPIRARGHFGEVYGNSVLVVDGPTETCYDLYGPTSPQRKAHSFLDLPAEIRNMIYRYTLVCPEPISIKLKFRVGDTNLLCANKQIFKEATEMFYHENVFEIPEPLFVGAPILEQLENFYHLPRTRLMTMRVLSLKIPVYGPSSDVLLKQQVERNLQSLVFFLHRYGPPDLKVSFTYCLGWAEDDYKTKLFDWRWAIFADINLSTNKPPVEEAKRRHWVQRFAERYQMPGLMEHYVAVEQEPAFYFYPAKLLSVE